MSPEEILGPFSLAAVRVTLKAIDTIVLQELKGSALRGAFGHAFRHMLCYEPDMECRFCHLQHKCVYAYIFETPIPAGDPFLNGGDAATHPYILRPPLDRKKQYASGEEISFELILFGKATDYLLYFAQAFIYMGQIGLGRGRGKFMVKHIDARNETGGYRLLYQSGDRELRNQIQPFTCRELLSRESVSDRCMFRFLTPLELRQKGKFPEISFDVIFKGLMRRIVTIAYLHNGIDCSSMDFSGLVLAAGTVRTIHMDMVRVDEVRYSNRQKAFMPFGGMLGSVTLAGDLSPFNAFMVLGQWVHVGKKTSFGFGRYELIQA